MLRGMLIAIALLTVGQQPVAGALAAPGEPPPYFPERRNKDIPASLDWQHVDVAPTKTFIYIGTVSMTMPTFTRGRGTYNAAYAAKVFPYFFYNETGMLTVDVSDAQLADLAAGKPIDITGTAVRTDGAQRRVTARATPADSRSGKLDVHVHYSKRIELIFHTTYRFQ